jgi:hypothetical protein
VWFPKALNESGTTPDKTALEPLVTAVRPRILAAETESAPIIIDIDRQSLKIGVLRAIFI